MQKLGHRGDKHHIIQSRYSSTNKFQITKLWSKNIQEGRHTCCGCW